MKANGFTIKLTAMVYTSTLTVHAIKVNGLMISSTAKARRSGQTRPPMMETTHTV